LVNGDTLNVARYILEVDKIELRLRHSSHCLFPFRPCLYHFSNTLILIITPQMIV